MLQEGSIKFLFKVCCDVLQACPSHSVLLLLCIVPLLFLFSNTVSITPMGQVFACAEDSAVCIRYLEQLSKASERFQLYASVSCLVLKPAKCVLILLACFASSRTIISVRSWLASNIPDWQAFSINNYGLYLDFQIGPTAGQHQWSSALTKCKVRVSNKQNLHEPAALVLRSYGSRAVTVLSFCPTCHS